MSAGGAVLVLVTFPDTETAKVIARTLVEERLAACVNLFPQVSSIYRWKGAVEFSEEVAGIIKTSESCYPSLESRIRALHPYEVPECLMVRVDAGSSAYLDWMAGALGSEAAAMPDKH